MDDHLILAAVDGSQNALIAAGVAARLAKLLGGRLGLVTVLQVPRVPLGFASGLFTEGLRDRLMEEARTEAEKSLQGVAERIQQACGLALPEYFLATGVPEIEIPKIIESDSRIMMVVVGREGFGTESKPRGLPHALGDLGAKLSMTLKVPVLIVPQDLHENHLCEGLRQLTAAIESSEN